MPTDKQRNATLFDDYFNSNFKQANTFSKEEYANSIAFFDRNYGRFLPPDKNSPILDLGSGAGHFLYYLKQKGFANFEGIDISPSQVEYCRTQISSKVTCVDAFEFLENNQNKYSFIACNDVLEHIPKEHVIRFLCLVHAALKPSGLFMVKCPNVGNPFALNLRYKDFTHECGYTESSLNQIFYLSGFRQITISGSMSPYSFPKNIVMAPLMMLLKLILKKLFWWQGFVSPSILSPVLIGRAQKSGDIQ